MKRVESMPRFVRPATADDGLTPTNLVLVAGYGNSISGFSHSRVPGDTDAQSDTDTDGVTEIFAFYCHPETWGSGVADTLMRETCTVLAAEATHAVLWTPTQAHRARRFYERSGFLETGRMRTKLLNDWGVNPTYAEVPAVEYRRDLS